MLDGWYKFYESLGDEHCAEVVALGCSLGYGGGDIFYYVVEGHVFLFYFFADDADVGLCLEGALEGYVAG